MAAIAISTTAAPIMAYGWPAGSRTWQVSNYWCVPDIGACHTRACHTGPCHTYTELGDRFSTKSKTVLQ